MDERGKIAAFSIPTREARPIIESSSAQAAPVNAVSFSNAEFAEIEYDFGANSIAAAQSKRRFFAPAAQAQPIGQSTIDPIREKFYTMRTLALGSPLSRNDAGLFYKQAKFMEEFTDDYRGHTPFSMYYPYYQHMGYEQLRTYFTWRSKVRRGEIQATSLSYVFLYIYELLSGVGVDSPADGLDRLMSIWNRFREKEPTLDRYLPRWLKDYHIYYELPHGFADFVNAHNLHKYYAELFLFDADAENCLALFNNLSSYDITKSKYYPGNEALLRDCFYAVLKRIGELCASHNIRIDELFVYSTGKWLAWYPFQCALFYHWNRQPDRQVEMSGRETYCCKDNRWAVKMPMYYAGERELVGYMIKKTEACLRQVMNYRFKITANPDSLHLCLQRLKKLGIPLQELDLAIEKAVADFHRSESRTIVAVDHVNLARIRKEALFTQDKLIVPEDNEISVPVEQLERQIEPSGLYDWAAFFEALSKVERMALKMVLREGTDLKAFADENGVMPEVLADGINEKAMDHIGDNIMEFTDRMAIYDEYKDKIAGMVG